jgi:hypothetical protein
VAYNDAPVEHSASPVVMPLKRLSICPCGYGVLVDGIQVGARYRLAMRTLRGGFSYRCGRCGGKQLNVRVVDCNSLLNPSDPMRPLPYGLFSGDAL